MRTIIAGSREISNNDLFGSIIDAVDESGFEITTVISGGARGADKAGEVWAEVNSIPVEIYNAEWSKYGKRAGYIRNTKMAEMAEALIAIWDGVSKGTKNMIDIAKDKNLKIYVKLVK